MKRKTLEYICVGEKVQLINTMGELGDGHPHQKNTERSPDTKKPKRIIV